MSTFNELGERTLNAVLQARANMVGGSPSPAMMPEIGPTLALEVDRPEWGYWKNEFHFGLYAEQTSVVGEHSILWIPPRTDFVQVITTIRMTAALTLNIGWRTAAPVWTLPVTFASTVLSDNRAPRFGGGYFVGTATAGNSAFDNAGAQILGRLTSTSPALVMPIVLRPGGPGLMIRSVSTANALNIVLNGYARPLTPNEQLG